MNEKDEDADLRVLTFTSLFPNNRQPLHGIFVEQRVRHLARRGHLVKVIAPVPFAPGWLGVERWRKMAEVAEEEQAGELEVKHPRYPLLPGISMPAHGLLMYLGCAAAAERLHAKHAFDYVDAHYVYPDGLAATLLGKRLGLPVVVTARGTDINLFPRFRWIRPQIRWTLRQAAGVVGVCEALRREMIRLGAAEEKARAIGNGVDVERFSAMPRCEARRKLGISEQATVIVSVGALVPAKGHDRLISAAARLRPRYPRLQVGMVGEGEARRELQESIERAGLSDCIRLMGAIPNENLRDWYNAADVSCLASSREGWANVLLESLACGTPVVATRVGGAAEVLGSEELGILVEVDAAAIAEGLDKALGKPWDREAMARYARTRTWNQVAKEVEEFVDSRIGVNRGALASGLPAGPSETSPRTDTVHRAG